MPGEPSKSQTQRDTAYDSKLLHPGRSPKVCAGTNKRAAPDSDQTNVLSQAQSRSGARNASVEDLLRDRPSATQHNRMDCVILLRSLSVPIAGLLRLRMVPSVRHRSPRTNRARHPNQISWLGCAPAECCPDRCHSSYPDLRLPCRRCRFFLSRTPDIARSATFFALGGTLSF